jgi:hypothetical protein
MNNYNSNFDSSSESNDEMFALVVRHRGVELSFLGVTGDGSDVKHDRQDLVDQLRHKHARFDCQNKSIERLDWIMQCPNDKDIARWACEQLDERNPDAGAQICLVGHSPRTLAIQVLLEEPCV